MAQDKQSRWGFRGKTVWSWLELLIVPFVLAIITVTFPWQQASRQQAIEDQRAQGEALQSYLNQMAELMLEEDLRNSEKGSEPRMLARSRTLSVLESLDSDHKRSVIQFLEESLLIQEIDGKAPIIALEGANLQDTNLRGAQLYGADLGRSVTPPGLLGRNRSVSLEPRPALTDLSGADLSSANLMGADLAAANLSGADLRGAIMTKAALHLADLSNANLSWHDPSKTSGMLGAFAGSADLSGAILYAADLSGANLSHTDLHNAIMFQTNLAGADLSDADLRNATLIGADLTLTDLSNADLTKADLTDARGLTNVYGPYQYKGRFKPDAAQRLEQETSQLSGATMPNGQKYKY